MAPHTERSHAEGAIQLFVIEDHKAMREMLMEYLSIVPDVQTVGSAASAEEALTELEHLVPDLLLVDVSLPGISGIDLVEKVRQRWTDMRCLMFSGHGEASYVRRSLEVGAQGYLLKDDPSEIPTAIRQVLDGQIYLSRSVRQFAPGGQN